MIQHLKTYAGIYVGALYGFALRLIFNVHILDDIYSLFSITFIWIVPIIIGLIPLLYANNAQIKRLSYCVLSPMATVLIFFIVCMATRIEDVVCIIVLTFPFLFGAFMCGAVFGLIIKKVRIKRGTYFPIIILPLLICPIEQQFVKPTSSYTVTTRVFIDAEPEVIWQHVIRVNKISDSEFQKGIFNYAGIPRPLYAELERDTTGALRTGYFEGGLKFIETVTEWQRDKEIAFDIQVVSSSIRATVFDQHVLMGDHFKFLNAKYTIHSLDRGGSELILTSSYQLTTGNNSYAAYWGNLLLSDFQERLLDVLKSRCQSHEIAG